MQAARAVDAAFSGADKKRTQPQPRLWVRRVRTLAALVHCLGHESQDPLPQGFAKRPNRETGRLAKSDDDRPGGPGIRIEEDRARPNPARIQPKLAPIGEPRTKRPVQPRFRAGEGIAAVVADQQRKSGERQVPMDDGELNPVVLQLRLLGIAYHEPTFAASNSPDRAAWVIAPPRFPAIQALLELTPDEPAAVSGCAPHARS